MKKVKKLLCVAAAVVGAVTAGAYVYAAADIVVTTAESYKCIYDNANISTETEENGNEYQRFSYNGNKNRARTYYDVKVADVKKSKSSSYADSGKLQVNYDVMYSNIDTEKDGEVQVKYRTGPGQHSNRDGSACRQK